MKILVVNMKPGRRFAIVLDKVTSVGQKANTVIVSFIGDQPPTHLAVEDGQEDAIFDEIVAALGAS